MQDLESIVKRIEQSGILKKPIEELTEDEILLFKEFKGVYANFCRGKYLNTELSTKEKMSHIASFQNEYKQIYSKLNAIEQSECLDKKPQELSDSLSKHKDGNPLYFIMKYNDETKVISTAEKELFEDRVISGPTYSYSKHVTHGQYKTAFDAVELSDCKFIPYSEATKEQKQLIKEKEEKIEKILNSKNPKYNKKGYAFFKTLEDENIVRIPIKTTPKELAKMGLLYNEYDFVPLRDLSKKELTEACKCYALSREEPREAETLIDRLRKRVIERGMD